MLEFRNSDCNVIPLGMDPDFHLLVVSLTLVMCRILKGVRVALQEELSDFLEIRGTWSIYIQEKPGAAKLAPA